MLRLRKHLPSVWKWFIPVCESGLFQCVCESGLFQCVWKWFIPVCVKVVYFSVSEVVYFSVRESGLFQCHVWKWFISVCVCESGPLLSRALCFGIVFQSMWKGHWHCQHLKVCLEISLTRYLICHLQPAIQEWTITLSWIGPSKTTESDFVLFVQRCSYWIGLPQWSYWKITKVPK